MDFLIQALVVVMVLAANVGVILWAVRQGTYLAQDLWDWYQGDDF